MDVNGCMKTLHNYCKLFKQTKLKPRILSSTVPAHQIKQRFWGLIKIKETPLTI